MVFLKKKVVLLYILLLTTNCFFCQENTNGLIISDKVEFPHKCIENIIKKYFNCGDLITLINPIDVTVKLISSITANNCYSLIIKSFTSHKWLVSTNLYIVVAEDYLNLSEGIRTVSRDTLWNPRAKFIVYVKQFNNTEFDDIFYIFLLHKMYRIVLIREEDNGTMLYSYLPFEEDNCGVDFYTSDDLIHLGECSDVDTINCFPDTETDKMSNCRFRVVSHEDIPNFIFDTKYVRNGKFIQGLEQYVLETFEEKEKVYIDYVVAPDKLIFGFVLPNGTATGLLGCLQNNQADIAAGGFILIKNRMELFDFVWGYNFAAFNVFTPAYEKNAWEDVYKEFNQLTWILIFLSYSSITITIILISKNKYDRTYLMLRIFGYLVGNTNPRFTRKKGIKVIMIFWIFFTFFICSFYNTALYSLITRFNTFTFHISDEQLSQLPYKPCISETTRTYFLVAYNQTLPKSVDYPECVYSESSLSFIASREDLYAIEMEYLYSLHEYKFVDHEGKKELDTWQFSINNVICLFFTRGFAFIEEIQKYAIRMFETGLLQHQSKLIHLAISRPVARYTKKFQAVCILDLRIHFIVLLVCSLLATIAFIFEVWFGRMKLHTKGETPNIRFSN